MSIHASTAWEVRVAGSGTNGGGFYDKNPGTSVDYSQQDSAQLALSDIASNGAGTGISSATGGFTAAMEGNVIYIGGTGFTDGWYHVNGYTDTNNITIDRSCGASQTNGTGNVGGAYCFASTPDTIFWTSTNKAQGNFVWIEAGTYTVTWNITISAAMINYRGYNTSRGDIPIANSRPYIDLGVGSTHYQIYFTSGTGYSTLKNLRISARSTGTAIAPLWWNGGGGVIENVFCERENAANASAALIDGDANLVVQCHFKSTIGYACQSNGSGNQFSFCYAEGGIYGFTYSGSGATYNFYDNCIAGACSVDGFKGYTGTKFSNCTAYGATTKGFNLGSYGKVFNSIVEGCGTGVSGGTTTNASHMCMYDNTTDYAGGMLEYGDGDITSDPLMTDPANGDFSLGASSPCFNTGLKLGAATGL